ncbi:sensor histidine kinase [Haloarchaeobius amylolyticus]|uniref:sensor histidine kinase n=1 Tax=Haloarchaeobius amylolyticus TaxID=1198296 RepID=UPI002271E5D0|nr:HAMP domain-containing sensor histidine kinase [Haloarchaeobius amylolyticus]
MEEQGVEENAQPGKPRSDEVMTGAETMEGEMRKELAVLHRVFRHNFRNQLNTIRGHAERAQSKTDDPEAADSLEIVLETTSKLIETVEEANVVEQLASSDATPEVVDLSHVLTECVERYDSETEAEFETHIPEGVWVWANPTIDHALGELIENAVEHNDDIDPRVRVRVSEGQTVNIQITDNGPGMPPGTASVLESTNVDSTNHLTSLGIWIAYWTITRSGGTLTASENNPTGCQIDVSLRAAPVQNQD